MNQFDDTDNFVHIESVCIEETTAGLQHIDPNLEMGFLAANADSGVCFSQMHWLGPHIKSGAASLPPDMDLMTELTTMRGESSWAAVSLRLPMRKQMKTDG